MAASSLANGSHRIDARILEGLAEEVTIARHPGIEDRPKVFNAYTAATAALIQPSLDGLAEAYRQACRTPCGRDAARIFLSTLLESED